jgi:hypothetical protein
MAAAAPPRHTNTHPPVKHPAVKAATATASKTHKATHTAVAAHHEAAPTMPAERATQIQAALIKQGYLTGEPSGTWDAQTAAAMEKMQADNGWQTKLTPDARALIKLGLGPNTTAPQANEP